MNASKKWRVTPAQAVRRVFALAKLRSSWHKAAVLMVAFALVIAVATRYTDYSDATVRIEKSVVKYDFGGKQQHIEKINFTWFFPLATFVSLKPPTSPLAVATIGVPISKILPATDLYNRPPPFLS
jgi:hypothetical protein